jgi:hypothetical protein
MNNRQIQLILENEYLNYKQDDLDQDSDYDYQEPDIAFEKLTKTKTKSKTKKTSDNHLVVNTKLCSPDFAELSEVKLDKIINHILTSRRLTMLNQGDDEVIVKCTNNAIFCFNIQDFINGADCNCVTCNAKRKKRFDTLTLKAAKNNLRFLVDEYIEGINLFPVKCSNNQVHILNNLQFYNKNYVCDCVQVNQTHNTNTSTSKITKIFHIPQSFVHGLDAIQYKTDQDILFNDSNPYPVHLHYTYPLLRRLLTRTKLPTMLILDNIDYISINIMYEMLKKSTMNETQLSIDHIIPVSFFDVDNIAHVRACWDLRNLRYMTSLENNIKSNGIRHIDLTYIYQSAFLTDVYTNILNLD